MTSIDERAPTGVLAAQISRAIVKVFHEYTGRGPTKARTTITDDMVVLLMSDTLLKAERNLVADGKVEQVLNMRRAFQDTMRQELPAVIEELVGRRVAAFISHTTSTPTWPPSSSCSSRARRRVRASAAGERHPAQAVLGQREAGGGVAGDAVGGTAGERRGAGEVEAAQRRVVRATATGRGGR